MILTTEEMKQAEQSAFERGVSAGDLMETAAQGIADVVRQFFPVPGKCAVFPGKGNNGGDALRAAGILRSHGWEIAVRTIFPEKECSELCLRHSRELAAGELPSNAASWNPDVILDGLLGIGASGAPREPIATAIREILDLRAKCFSRIVAVDLPSGLDSASGEPSEITITADVTVCLGAAKVCLLADAATDFVGRIALVDLPALQLSNDSSGILLCPSTMRDWLPMRRFQSYKGTYGHVGVIAGSLGFYGAARLCCDGALRSGAGLVSLLTKPESFPYLASTASPEVMVKPLEDFRECIGAGFDVLAIGPGLQGEGVTQAEIAEIVRLAECPVVLDAGALDFVGAALKTLRLANGPRILTPHPGEMERLYPRSGRGSFQLASDFVESYPCVLTLKGARTVIAAPGKPLYFNSTGNPGMGTAGMGDVLTGVIAALCAQGLRPSNASAMGAWVCGRAAEKALASGESEQSLLASDIPKFLGRAFQALQRGY